MEEICSNLGNAWDVCREGTNLYRVTVMGEENGEDGRTQLK